MLKAFISIFISAIFMGIICCSDASGQTAPASLSVPDWVKMMDDPNVNYFEAIASYKSYWLTHAKPIEEEEEMGQVQTPPKGDLSDREREREEKERESRKKKLKGSRLEETEYLKYQSKRFENWAREVKPWVQENGHVLTDEERAEIARKQQEELQQQNKK